MIQRLAAIAGAVALVAAAFVVRETIIEDDDGGSGSSPGSTELVCASELPDGVCPEEAALDDIVADLVGEDPPAITWVTPGPWPQMVDEARAASSRERIFVDVRPLATTDIVAVVHQKPSQCPEEITWRCLGDSAAASGRIAAPSTATGVRLLIRAAMLGGFIGATEYASNDLDEVAGARDWIESADKGIEQARRRQASSLREFLATRGAAADVFITTAAEAGAFDSLDIVRPQPPARVIATLGTTGRFDAGAGAEELRRARWSTDPASLTGDLGLPSPGVLLALREVGS